jgi:hypothetical protein
VRSGVVRGRRLARPVAALRAEGDPPPEFLSRLKARVQRLDAARTGKSRRFEEIAAQLLTDAIEGR